MSICDNCIHDDVCGLEDSHEEAITFCSGMLPKDKYEEWIPVSERLPEDDGKYLVTMKGISNYFYISTTSYAKDLYKVDKYDFKSEIGDGWYNYDGEYGHYKVDNVVAWMPLPKPYEPQERRDKNEIRTD